MGQSQVGRVQVTQIETMWIFFEKKHTPIWSYSFLPDLDMSTD